MSGPSLQQQAFAYTALQRLWVTLDPASAELRWQQEFAFFQLPDALKAPGHWYRHQDSSGYIHYLPSGDAGEFLTELPAGLDPASVVVIPRVSGFPSIAHQMKTILLATVAVQGEANVQRMVADIDELKSATHAGRVKSLFAGEGFSLQVSGKEAVAAFLAQQSQAFSTSELQANRVTGFEAAAVMLLHAIHRQLLTASPAPPANLFSKMFDPTGVTSLPEMAARFIHDCYASGMADAVDQAIDNIRIDGDATLTASRALPQNGLDAGVYLDSYYAGLQQAAVRYFAVRWAWQSVLVVAGLSGQQRQRAEKRVNAVEEKLVRCETAIMFSVRNLDGSRYREQQHQIRDAKAAGDDKKAAALLANAFDSQLFYPEAVKAGMLQSAAPPI